MNTLLLLGYCGLIIIGSLFHGFLTLTVPIIDDEYYEAKAIEQYLADNPAPPDRVPRTKGGHLVSVSVEIDEGSPPRYMLNPFLVINLAAIIVALIPFYLWVAGYQFDEITFIVVGFATALLFAAAFPYVTALLPYWRNLG